MKRIGHLALWTAALLVANLGVATAQTQVAPPTQNTPPGGMMGPGSGTPMMGAPARMGMMGMMGMADHVEGRLAFLKAELKITDAQTSQWNAFSDALRENARRMGGMSATMMQGGMMGQGGASMSAPDRLDRMEKMMTAMLESIKATRVALAPLYAVLADEQKKVADQLIHGAMGMGRM
jgi:LTXXQ motif family protein